MEVWNHHFIMAEAHKMTGLDPIGEIQTGMYKCKLV